RSLQYQSEELEKSGGLISIEMHERILHDQTEFYDKALHALDDLERSCMDRTQDCIAASFCSEPESQVGLLRGKIAAEACATATMEQDAELLEEQIRVLSQKLEASASQIAQLKDVLLVERSSRDAFRSSLGHVAEPGSSCGAPEVAPEDSADLPTLRAVLSSRHQEIAELEAKMIEAQDEELRLRKKLPLLEAQAKDSAAQAEAAAGCLGTLRRKVDEAAAQTAWRWQQLPRLQRALLELVDTQRDILGNLRSQAIDGLNFDALCMDLPHFPPGDSAVRSPDHSQVHARGRELKTELQASRGALRSAMTSLRALEPSFEAEVRRAGQVVEILCASLPPDLPDSVQSLLDKAQLQAVGREEVPSQILEALVAELRASLQAGRGVKEREAVQAAAAGFRAAQTKQKPNRLELSALQGRSATAAAQVADLSARLYTLGRDMCDAETDSSEQVLKAEAELFELCRQTEDAGVEQRKATESAAQLRKALEAQISTTTAAIHGAAEEAKESLQRAVAEASAETEALSEMLPSEITRVEEACAQQVRAKAADLQAEASRCRSLWRLKLEELAGQQHDLETRQSESSGCWAEAADEAQKELEEVWKSLATARKEIQAIREVRGSCEKATETHRDRLWDLEQTATDVRERRAVELRREEMELQQQLRGYAERTQELETQIRHEEEDQQQTWREEARALAAELTPELDE
ncbi:Cbwd1, partial [Symbiodinium sp. CCMP2456]